MESERIYRRATQVLENFASIRPKQNPVYPHAMESGREAGRKVPDRYMDTRINFVQFPICMPSYLILSFVIVSCSTPAPIAVNTPQFDGVVIPHLDFTSEDYDFLRYSCSRLNVGKWDGVWTPTTENVIDLERRLLGFYNRAAIKYDQKYHLFGNPKSLHLFKRQYYGFMRGDKQFVYINAYLVPPEDLHEAYEPRFNHERPFFGCHNGLRSFGVEYDVRERRFHEFRFDYDV